MEDVKSFILGFNPPLKLSPYFSRPVGNAEACPTAGKGEGVAVVFTVVSFIVVLLVVRQICLTRMQDLSQ